MGTSKLSGKPDERLGGRGGGGGGKVTCDGLASRPRGVVILLVASCYGNRDKLQAVWATRLVCKTVHFTGRLIGLFFRFWCA